MVKTIKLIAYGSLREGCYNHDRFGIKPRIIGKTTISGYKLYSLGVYPAVCYTANEEDKLVVDLLEVPLRVGTQIDYMEIDAGYYIDSLVVGTDAYKIYPYIKNLEGSNCPVVEGGDWLEYTKKKNK